MDPRIVRMFDKAGKHLGICADFILRNPERVPWMAHLVVFYMLFGVSLFIVFGTTFAGDVLVHIVGMVLVATLGRVVPPDTVQIAENEQRIYGDSNCTRVFGPRTPAGIQLCALLVFPLLFRLLCYAYQRVADHCIEKQREAELSNVVSSVDGGEETSDEASALLAKIVQ